jgi:hypothetical protein
MDFEEYVSRYFDLVVFGAINSISGRRQSDTYLEV